MDFIRELIKNPKDTGAIAASSPELAKLIVREADIAHARVIVELGPGTGPFTEEILAKRKGGTAYLGIEINERFVDQLKKRFPQEAFVQGSVEDIARFLKERGFASCDRVISGIPWLGIEHDERVRMIQAVHDVLEDKGIFVTFAYFPLNHLPKGKEFKELLEETFASVEKSDLVLANLPPAFVYVCRKG